MIQGIVIFFLITTVLSTFLYWHDTREADRIEARERGK